MERIRKKMDKKKYYILIVIVYVLVIFYIGNVYEIILVDVIVCFKCLEGYDVYF